MAGRNVSASRRSKGRIPLSGLPKGQTITPECEISFEGGDKLHKLFNDCVKNPRHPNFIPVNDFQLEHLPKHLQTARMLRIIKKSCNLTVRVEVRYTSTGRPDTYQDSEKPFPYSQFKGDRNRVRFGTGTINISEESISKTLDQCPCHLCQKSTKPETGYWTFIVQTATHVIYDDSEAECSVFECFFDLEIRRGVKTLYGLRTSDGNRIPGSQHISDSVEIECVTHDSETATRLLREYTFTADGVFDTMPYRVQPPEEVIVSHPHGCSKRVTVGNILYLTAPIQAPYYATEKAIPFPKGTICRLPLKPWISDKTQSETGINTEIFKMLLKYDAKIQNIIARATKKDNEIGDIIFKSAYHFYTFVTMRHLFCCTIRHGVSVFDHTIKVIIWQRLQSMKFSQNKTPDLIDIGFLLWRCCLTIVMELTKSIPNAQQNLHDISALIIQAFITDILTWKPQFRRLFDMQFYVTERAEETGGDDEFSAEEAVKTMVTIITRNDTALENEDLKCLYDMFSKNKDMNEAIRRFAHLAHIAVKTCFEIIPFSEKKKTLISPESEEYLQPGTEFELHEGMTFTLPPDAEFAFRYYKGNPGYYIFPPGTKFQWILSLSGEEVIVLPIPEEAEFISSSFGLELRYVVKYNIDTCPGSSGAALYLDLPRYISGRPCLHSGADENKVNMSGIVSSHGNVGATKSMIDQDTQSNLPTT